MKYTKKFALLSGECKRKNESMPPFKQIFTSIPFLALVMTQFMYVWASHVLILGTPTYLNDVQGLALKEVEQTELFTEFFYRIFVTKLYLHRMGFYQPSPTYVGPLLLCPLAGFQTSQSHQAVSQKDKQGSCFSVWVCLCLLLAWWVLASQAVTLSWLWF